MGVVSSKQPDPRKPKRRLPAKLAVVMMCVTAFVVFRNHSKEKRQPRAGTAAAERTELVQTTPPRDGAPNLTKDSTLGPSPPAGASPDKAATKAPGRATDEIDAFAKDMMDPKNGFYDPHYKVAGKFPEGWVVRGAPRWGTEETTIFFEDPEFPRSRPSLYYRMFPEPMAKSDQDVRTWLREEAIKKEEQRLSSYPDYMNGEVKQRTIGERPALSWTATYTRNGEPWAEYLTRIYTPKGTYLFFMQAPEKDMPTMMTRFERVITTTIMP